MTRRVSHTKRVILSVVVAGVIISSGVKVHVPEVLKPRVVVHSRSAKKQYVEFARKYKKSMPFFIESAADAAVGP